MTIWTCLFVSLIWVIGIHHLSMTASARKQPSVTRWIVFVFGLFESYFCCFGHVVCGGVLPICRLYVIQKLGAFGFSISVS